MINYSAVESQGSYFLTYLKIRGRIEEELVPQKRGASSKYYLMALESLLVAGYNGNVTEVLAASQ